MSGRERLEAATMMGVPQDYGRHRKWALATATRIEDSDEARIMGLVALWDACREWDGEGSLRDFALPRIEKAVQRERAP
jgi:hypothetical protein